ncbi:unnamed protein product [Arctogadus glacialis]
MEYICSYLNQRFSSYWSLVLVSRASFKDSFISVELFVSTSVFLQFISSILFFKLLMALSSLLGVFK